MTGNKLRVGIITSLQMPAWAFYVIEQLRASDYATVSLIIEESSLGKKSLTARIIQAYLRAERRSSRPHSEDDIQTLIDGIPLASLSDPILPAHKLDLILHLGAHSAPSNLAETARFGLWEISDGERAVHAVDIPGFFEVLHQEPITNCSLWASHGKSSRVLLNGPIATDPISISRNRENFFWKASILFLKAIRTLYYKGEFIPHINSEVKNGQSSGTKLNILDLMSLGISQVSRYVTRKIRKRVYRDQWVIMFAKDIEGIPSDWDVFRPLYPPIDRFWADPFVIARDSHFYVFIEELPYSTKLGHIACLVLDANENLLDNRRILEKPYHLSYPFIFEYRENLYMIPETGANKTIDVYRCTSFPFEWEFHKTLMKGVEAKDATLTEYHGKWWLFATVHEHQHGSTWDQLSLYWADTPLADKWTSHPLNPVVVDVRTARPAGNIFIQNGEVIRPSQDCSIRYGYAVNFNRITKLSETEYEELLETRFLPPKDKNILATHTFNVAGEFVIIDAVIRRKKR